MHPTFFFFAPPLRFFPPFFFVPAFFFFAIWPPRVVRGVRLQPDPQQVPAW